MRMIGFWVLAGGLTFFGPVGQETDRQNPADRDQVQQDQPEQKVENKFMREKLMSSQQILEGLTTENFKLVEDGAKELNTMTKAEQWRVSNDVMYKQFSEEYQRKTAALEQAALEADLNQISLKWVSVTLSCIECHTWVRGKRIADARIPENLFAKPELPERSLP